MRPLPERYTRLVHLLEDLREEFASRADIEDGDYDGPKMNWEMRMLDYIETELNLCGRSPTDPGAISPDVALKVD